jgi:hypothetical protein
VAAVIHGFAVKAGAAMKKQFFKRFQRGIQVAEIGSRKSGRDVQARKQV